MRIRARLVPLDDRESHWRAVITAYQYALLDREGREYLAYHWHPDGQSHMLEPHLHLGVAAQVGVPEIAAAHLPTGPIALAAVARLTLTDLGARPLRADWHGVLASAMPILSPA
ncbi:MAG: hypothetical protein U0893_27805 [Chloroflexota bacterium]